MPGTPREEGTNDGGGYKDGRVLPTKREGRVSVGVVSLLRERHSRA